MRKKSVRVDFQKESAKRSRPASDHGRGVRNLRRILRPCLSPEFALSARSCVLPAISCDSCSEPWGRVQLSAENLFLRKQLALYVERQVKPRRADDVTRSTLVILSWLAPWRDRLTIVKPDTLIRWHRRGFQLLWRWKSRPHGRPPLPADLRRLITEMASANRIYADQLGAPWWCAGAAVEHLRAESRERRTGVRFFVVVTATFRVYYVFVVLEVGSRRIRHWNVTAHPTAE